MTSRSRRSDARSLENHFPLPFHQERIISDTAFNSYTALVIAYRDPELVRGVLERLTAQTLPPRQVLIVDNGGTFSESDLAVLPLSDRTVLISRPDNPGYGAAVNEARGRLGGAGGRSAEHSSESEAAADAAEDAAEDATGEAASETAGDALLVLTHDADFGPSLAAELLAALDRRDGCAAPLLRFSNDRNRVFSAGGALTRGGRAYHLETPKSAVPYQVEWVDGAIAMYTSRALERIGWVSEEYFLYFEDVDTGWRLSQQGLACLIVPNATAYQQPGAHPMYLGVRNMVLFARKRGIGAARNSCSVAYRVAREALSKLRRRQPMGLGDAWRGWRDGRAGLSGKPSD